VTFDIKCTLFPIKASLYGGEYSGDITYDAHEAVPSVKLDQQVTTVNIEPLLKDSINSERLSSRGRDQRHDERSEGTPRSAGNPEIEVEAKTSRYCQEQTAGNPQPVTMTSEPEFAAWSCNGFESTWWTSGF
jgi:hypothetical protein